MVKKIVLVFCMVFSLLATVGLAAPEPSKSTVLTGIVIDASGLGLERAMSPVIVDTNGRVLNKLIPIDLVWVANNGGVEYYSKDDLVEIANGNSRAGNNYIILKAQTLKDFNRNPVISVEDADKLLLSPDISEIFKTAKIVFIE